MTTNKPKLEFLYAGDIWSALWGEKCGKGIGKTIAYAIAKSPTVFTTENFSFSEYSPKGSLIKFISVIKHQEENNLFYSIFPFCKGIENELIFCDMLGCEEDNIEGYVKLKKNDAVPMWMFNPLYRQQQEYLLQHVSTPNEKLKFKIAGIGLKIIKTPQSSIKIFTGEKDYKTAINEFLQTNPDKSEDDFPLLEEADASHIKMLDVSICDDSYDFSSDIYAISEFKYHGEKFYCLQIEVLGYSDEEFKDISGMRVNLYVNKKSLGKYKPQIGDNISGIMQLTAYAVTD